MNTRDRLSRCFQLRQEIQNLGLNGNVEGRDGFIGNDDLRLQGKRACNADPLTLAA